MLRCMLYRSCCGFFCALRLCTKICLDLQGLIEELYILQQQSSCYAISKVLGFVQGEVSTRTSPIGHRLVSSTIGSHFGIGL